MFHRWCSTSVGYAKPEVSDAQPRLFAVGSDVDLLAAGQRAAAIGVTNAVVIWTADWPS
jgi:hypothetical protein